MPEFSVRTTTEGDRAFIRNFMTQHWFGEAVIVHGEFFYPSELPGFIAENNSEIIDLATYQIRESGCEIITLDSLKENVGIGSQLLESVKHQARQSGCKILSVITTNDNLNGLGFYQKRGFKIQSVFPGATDRSRELKPTIPLLGEDGIPIRDEILLEMELTH